MTKKSLTYLFWTFLQIGFTAFGGHVVLVAAIREKLVQKDQVISEDIIIDNLAIASMLPGPLAVNCVACIGYYLRGWWGAMLSITAVLLPSILMMILLAHFYETVKSISQIKDFIHGVLPLVIAMVASVSYGMFKKQIVFSWQKVLFILALVSSLYIKGIFAFIVMLLIGAVTGLLIGYKAPTSETAQHPKINLKKLLFVPILFLIVFGGLILLLQGINQEIFQTFSIIGLTLFGGGYVMIPILHDLIVLKKGWLPDQIFLEAIAFGQLTPGPILVSASFIGYYVSGLTGTILATVGIFLPPAILTIVVSAFFSSFKNNQYVKLVFQGFRPIVIALIAYSVVVLSKSIEINLFSTIIFIIGFCLLTFTKFNFFLLVLISGLLGLIF